MILFFCFFGPKLCYEKSSDNTYFRGYYSIFNLILYRFFVTCFSSITPANLNGYIKNNLRNALI